MGDSSPLEVAAAARRNLLVAVEARHLLHHCMCVCVSVCDFESNLMIDTILELHVI